MRFRWADCELDREGRTLERAGRSVRVQPLVLDLLLLLLHHRGRVVSENVLRRRLWRDVQVTDASLRRLVKEARRAVGDDGERQEQIQTIRGRGIRFSAAVTTDDGWDTSFVGRADVVEALERKLEEVAGGLGGLTLLHGAAGIGKTRTLAEFEARAGMRGFRVLHGSGRAEAEGDAFHPWLDVARELGIDEILQGAPDDAGARSTDASNADARRYASFRAVAKTLARIARERPILIALDDLQLADRDGLEALRFLAPALIRAPVWILGAFRTGGGSRTERALRVLATLGADTSTQDLALRGLPAGELRALVRNHLRTEVGEPLADLLSKRADGNPLFSLEIARSLQREGHSLDDDPAPSVEADLAHGIEPLLARRLSALPAEAQRLLCTASALGTEFDSELLQAAEGCSADDLAAALDVCEIAGLLEPRSAGKWRFAHPLFAEAMYAALDSEREGGAAAQHLRIAEALDRLGETDPFLLARHFLLARPAVTAERALPYMLAAAEEAQRRLAVADAELWYRRAAALAEESDLPQSERCDLALASADAIRTASGIHSARPSFDEAARLAVALGDRRRLALAALRYANRPFPLGADPSILRWLRTAQAAPCDDIGLRACVSSRLGAELLYAGPEHAEESRSLLAEGLARARELGDPIALGPVLMDCNTADFRGEDIRSRLLVALEIEQCGRATGKYAIELHGLHERAAAHLELGERSEVEAVLGACQRFARKHPFPASHLVASGIQVMISLLDGRWGDARRQIEAVEQAGRTIRDVGFLAVVGGQRFLLAREEGRLDQLLDPLRLARDWFPNYPAALDAPLGLAHALSNDLEPARGTLARVLERLPSLPRDRSRLLTLVLAAEIAYRTGASEAAALLEPELAPFAALGAVGGGATAYFGSVSQALGWLAAVRGDSRTAVEHFQHALHCHEALRSAPWCARSTQAIAEVRHLRVVSSRRRK